MRVSNKRHIFSAFERSLVFGCVFCLCDFSEWGGWPCCSLSCSMVLFPLVWHCIASRVASLLYSLFLLFSLDFYGRAVFLFVWWCDTLVSLALSKPQR